MDKEYFHITVNSHQDIFDLRKEFERVEVISRDDELPLLWTVLVGAEDKSRFIEWCENRNVDTGWNDYHVTPDIIMVASDKGYSFVVTKDIPNPFGLAKDELVNQYVAQMKAAGWKE